MKEIKSVICPETGARIYPNDQVYGNFALGQPEQKAKGVEKLAKKESLMVLWDEPASLKEIREIFAPTLTETEFKSFIGLGKGTGLNPFLKEIYAVKYDKTKPATFIIARDGYRKSAQSHPDYDYHRTSAVYSNDEFQNDNGKINHKYGFGDRGQLLGAYCLVKRKSSSEPMYVDVPLKEYDQTHSCWRNMKETMIKKVAEAQCLKASFQELFAGSMSDDEYQIAKATEKKNTSNPVLDLLKPSVATPAQLDIIRDLIDISGMTKERLAKAKMHFCVADIEDLTEGQADEFIAILNKGASK
jgi:phage recombination protein Bet